MTPPRSPPRAVPARQFQASQRTFNLSETISSTPTAALQAASSTTWSPLSTPPTPSAKLATSSSSLRIKWGESACRPSSTSSPTSSSCRTMTPASSNLFFCKRRPVPRQKTSTSPSCLAKNQERMPLPLSGSQTSPTPTALSTEIPSPCATSYSASTSPSTISSPTRPTHSCSLPARTCPPSSPATASSLSQPNNRHYLLSGIFKKSPTASADRVNREE